MPAKKIAAFCLLALATSTRAFAAQSTAPFPVIDVHMHTPASRDMGSWRTAMQELNVRHAVLIGVPRQWGEADGAGDPVFLPSLMFPCEGGRAPNFGLQCFDAGEEFPPVDQLRRWAAEGRVRVLGEILSQYMGVRPDDERMRPYYALAEELDLPVGIHIGFGPPGVAYQRPGSRIRPSPNYRAAAGDLGALEDMLVRYPRMRVYVMHAAWPRAEDMIYMLYMHPNLHVDVAVLQWAIPRAAYYLHLRALVDAGFANRIMFGSDGGVQHLRSGIAAIMEADFLTEEQKRAILHDNAARFFRLNSASESRQ